MEGRRVAPETETGVTQMRVLLVESNASQAQAVELILNRAGMVVETADSAEDGVDQAMHYDYDIVVLNMKMPDMRGLDFLKRLRRNKINTPVLSVQAGGTTADSVAALNAGGDDYLPMPFDGNELTARVVSLVRRSRSFASSDINLGNMTLNLDSKRVAIDGAEVRLSGKEYQLLELLVMRRGTSVTKEMILNHLYGGLDEPEAKIIDVFICKIRKKMKGMVGAGIETVWGRGYMMNEGPSATMQAPGAVRAA